MDSIKFNRVKRTVIRILLVLGYLTFGFLVQAQTPETPEGEGTSEVPYEIATLGHLYWLTQHPSEWGASYIQTADIDASSTSLWNNGAGWTPIGNYEQRFTGTYDGRGYKISGVSIQSDKVTYVGFFGFLSDAVIENLGLTRVSVTVARGTYAGGLVGTMQGGTTKGCFVTGSIEAEATNIGGLIGYQLGTSEVLHCYSDVNINSIDLGYYIGGLAGNLRNGLISGSYACGRVSYSDHQGITKAGGLIGNNRYGDVAGCYWNIGSTGLDQSAGGTGLHEEDMKRASSFASWDFDDIWVIEEGATYPFLRDNLPSSLPGFAGFAGGDGSESNPFQVNRPVHLHQVRNYPDSHFLQTAHIDMAACSEWDKGKGFKPIGIPQRPFAGSYDGQGYVVSNLGAVRPLTDQVALFGYTTGTLSRIGLVKVALAGHNETGAVVGVLDGNGSVDQCYSTGMVQGRNEVGGLAGNIQSGTVSNSYSECEVSGTEHTGGLAGYMDSFGMVTQSYSTGRVLGSSYTGGLLGSNEGGMVVQSYWNVESSGQPASAGGLGLTAAMMRQRSSYTDWDFTDKWNINEGESYAYLSEFPLRSMHLIIAGGAGWRMYGSPYYQSTFGTIVNDLWTQGYTDSDDPLAEANLFIWEEANAQWEVPESGTEVIKPARGFILYVYEDDDVDTPGIQGGFPKTITHELNLVNALPLSVPLSYTSSGATSSRGFNLMANPTSSTLNWDNIDKINVTGSYYTWDAANKEYDIYQTGVGGINGGTHLIDPFQGYWVRALANPASITIGDPAVVDYDEQIASTPLIKKKILDTLVLQLKDETGKSDELRVVVREDAKPGLDALDAVKLPSLASSYFSLSSIAGENNLAIDSRPTNGINPLVIDLAIVSVNLPSTKSYKLALTQDNIIHWKVELENMATGQRHNLREHQVDVSTEQLATKRKGGQEFTVHLAGTEPNWQLILTPVATGVEGSGTQLPEELRLNQNYPNPFNPLTTIQYELPGDGRVRLLVSDVTGRTVATLVSGYQKAGSYEIDFDASHLASGIYMYSLYTSYGQIQHRMTIIK